MKISMRKIKIIIASSMFVFLVLLVVTFTILYYTTKIDIGEALSRIEITNFNDNMPKTKYNNSIENNSTAFEEYNTIDLSEFSEEYTTYITETSMSLDVSEPNAELYSLCDRYFVVTYGSNRLSPLLPLAMANVETPGRADHNITWSALFPSAIVPVELMSTMDVTTVVSDKKYFDALSSEWSTRDRGALQMSPTYGTGNDAFNNLMSGTETDKLSAVDTSKYSTWASGASNKSGDRFYIPDVLLRLSSAFTSAINQMVKNSYIPDNDAQMIAMLAMYHHRSGVWSGKASGGNTWKSSDLAYLYSQLISTQEFIDYLREYSAAHESTWCLTTSEAKSIYGKFYDNMSEFCSSDIVLTYPIKVLYSYTRMAQLYGG